MRFLWTNIACLRRSLALFALLVAGSATMALAAWRLAAHETAAHHQALAEREQLRARLAHTDQEAADILRKISRYDEMRARGRIGPERRLDWVERITQAAAAHRLADLRFEIAPQQPAAPGIAGGHEFLSSKMELRASLLHEGELLSFLDDLAASVPAFGRVRGCNVERIAAQSITAAAHLRIECSIEWITLQKKKS